MSGRSVASLTRSHRLLTVFVPFEPFAKGGPGPIRPFAIGGSRRLNRFLTAGETRLDRLLTADGFPSLDSSRPADLGPRAPRTEFGIPRFLHCANMR